MTILVEVQDRAGQRRGDWIVRNGRRGKILSSHRKKSRAVERAKREARKRGTNVKIQNTNGRWKQGPSYG